MLAIVKDVFTGKYLALKSKTSVFRICYRENKMKARGTDRAKIFAKHLSDKLLAPRVYIKPLDV